MNKSPKPRKTAPKKTPKYPVPETPPGPELQAPTATAMNTRVVVAGGRSLN